MGECVLVLPDEGAEIQGARASSVVRAVISSLSITQAAAFQFNLRPARALRIPDGLTAVADATGLVKIIFPSHAVLLDVLATGSILEMFGRLGVCAAAWGDLRWRGDVWCGRIAPRLPDARPAPYSDRLTFTCAGKLGNANGLADWAHGVFSRAGLAVPRHGIGLRRIGGAVYVGCI